MAPGAPRGVWQRTPALSGVRAQSVLAPEAKLQLTGERSGRGEKSAGRSRWSWACTSVSVGRRHCARCARLHVTPAASVRDGKAPPNKQHPTTGSKDQGLHGRQSRSVISTRKDLPNGSFLSQREKMDSQISLLSGVKMKERGCSSFSGSSLWAAVPVSHVSPGYWASLSDPQSGQPRPPAHYRLPGPGQAEHRPGRHSPWVRCVCTHVCACTRVCRGVHGRTRVTVCGEGGML